jgi:catechol 2,3-dioxygenase-like lactoylglutathione lyase family enzyme
LGDTGTENYVKIFEGINVVSLSVTDLDDARRFYRDVLSLGEPLYDLPDAGWIEFRGCAQRQGLPRGLQGVEEPRSTLR